MKTQIIETPRRAQLYWLNKSEAENTTFMTFLQSMISIQKEQGTFPVITESGESNPEEMVYLLLKRNIDRPHTELSKAS